MQSSALVHRAQAAAPVDASTLIVSYLAALGVEYVFGVPGGAIEPLYNALAASMRRGGPRPVLARHEAGAAFMADGYARESGKLGVCCGTSGPGATNLLTGVACSYENNVPLLVITGQPALSLFGKRALQESSCTGINTVGMFRHCTRYNTLISHPEQVESKLTTALMRAMHQPAGPVHLSFPVDLLRAEVSPRLALDDFALLLQKPALVDEAAVQGLFASLKCAKSSVLIIGASAGEAIGSILAVAEATGSPFVTTPDAKGLVNGCHPLYRGVFGFAGHASARAALRENSDLVVAIGTSLGEWTSGAWSEAVLNRRLVHVHEADEPFAQSPMAQRHVRGRIRKVFERLLELDAASPLGQGLPRRPVRVTPSPAVELRDPQAVVSNQAPIKPQRLMRELSERFPPHTRFVADAGNSTAWAIHYLELQDRRGAVRPAFAEQTATVPVSESGEVPVVRVHRERRRDHAGWLRVLMDFAPMGWAIGAAVGMARASPGCPVVCITGDGSYLMNGQEITVAAQEQLTVIFLILNDAALGMVKHGQRLAGAERVAFELPNVDYRLLAQSLGISAHQIASPADFERLDLDEVLRRKGPTLLDVRIDGEEVPPMQMRLEALGSAR